MERKPKVLYYFPQGIGKKKRLKHIVTKDCLITRESPILTQDYWRCQHYEGHNGPRHDLYGFGSVSDAKLQEIADTYLRIAEEKEWLKYLLK